jgi:hypothetical protein
MKCSKSYDHICGLGLIRRTIRFSQLVTPANGFILY